MNQCHRQIFMSIFLCCMLCSTSLSALDLSISIARFQSAEGPYLEFNIFVLAPTVQADPVNQKRSIELTVLINNARTTVHADRLHLTGPADGSNFNTTRRYAMEAGTYQYLIRAKDLTDTTNIFFWEDTISILPKPNQPRLSDILLLSDVQQAKEQSPMVKHGYILHHLPFNYSKAHATKVYYYLESYLPGMSEGIYQLRIRVEEAYKNRRNQRIYERIKKRHVRPLDVIVGRVNTDDLPSGNYCLVIQLLDDQLEPISETSTYFQHSNPDYELSTIQTKEQDKLQFLDALTDDQLHYSLRAITPRMSSIYIETANKAIKSRARSQMLHALKFYWSHTEPQNPQKAYNEYMQVARAVDREFQSGFGAGFDTDRGYFYLKYGKPSMVIGDRLDPIAPPYEIWTYNEIPELRQTNVKFIFYNPSLAPGDFRLLHSTANGEINNPRWEAILYKNAPNDVEGNNFMDNPRVSDRFRRNAIRYFEDN